MKNIDCKEVKVDKLSKAQGGYYMVRHKGQLIGRIDESEVNSQVDLAIKVVEVIQNKYGEVNLINMGVKL